MARMGGWLRSRTWQDGVLLLRRALAGVILAGVTWLSLTDSDGLRAHEVLHILVRIYRATGVAMDKQVHAAMYFAVCGAVWLAMRHRPNAWPTPLKAFLFATGWGMLMEFAQLAETALGWGRRGFDVADMVANACGAAAAALICATLWPLWQGSCALWRKWRGRINGGPRRDQAQSAP